MCTYSFSFNDAAINRIRPAFKDDAAVQEWLQQHLEMLIMQFQVSSQTPTNGRHSLSHLRGIFAESGMTEKELKDEYLNRKHGV